MAKRISIKDIAEKAGVSTALVSYVLNGKEREARIGPEIANKVKKIAKQLNYQPNLIARGLRFGKTKTIGLIVADISNPFFSSLARIIENEAKKNGYTVIFGSSDEQLDKSQSLIDTLLNRRVDGLIITPVEGAMQQIKSLKEKGAPVVLIDRGIDETKTSSVIINNFDSVYESTNLLIKNGYRKIAMLAYDTSLSHMQERIRGYMVALKDNKIKFNASLLIKVSYEHTAADIEKQLKSLLAKNAIDACMCATNSISINTLKLIMSLHLVPPSDLGIVCFDESEVYDFFKTPVTYIKQDLQQIGAAAVQTLLRAIEKSDPGIYNTVVKSTLVMGKSAGEI